MALSTRSSRSAKPRTYAQAREAYSTTYELGWWVFMRVSGLFLIFLVGAHVFINNILVDAGTIDYQYAAQRLAQPSVKVFDSFLLTFAMLHGVNGLRYSIEDYFSKPGTRFWLKTLLFVVAGALLIAGIMTLWAFSYQEMGDAIRNLTPPQ